MVFLFLSKKSCLQVDKNTYGVSGAKLMQKCLLLYTYIPMKVFESYYFLYHYDMV